MAKSNDARWVWSLLIITIAMGMLDAVSLLHLGTFTGYMTGTVILIGIGVVQGLKVTAASMLALASFLVGALMGGRLVRRRHSSPRLVSDVLLGAAALVGIAAAVHSGGGVLVVAATLGLAMGLQTSATRHAGVADMSMPAATMVLHGLVHDSRLAGGRGDRVWRRLGTLLALVGGAMVGTLMSALNVPAAIALVSLLLFAAAAVLRRIPAA